MENSWLAHSILRGPQADTLLLVDIPSTRGSHTWTLTPNGSPPFRTVWGLSILFFRLLYTQFIVIYLVFSEERLLVDPPFRLTLAWNPPPTHSQSSSPPLRLALDCKLLLFSTSLLLPLSSPLWPPRPQESKVIRIQSDHSPSFLFAGCCHGTVQLPYPSWRKGRGSH